VSKIKSKSVLEYFLIFIIIFVIAWILVSTMVFYFIFGLSENSNILYRHPFAVTNATREIDKLLIEAELNFEHFYHEEKGLGKIVSKNNEIFFKIKENIKIIEDRFLGEKEKVVAFKSSFEELVKEQAKFFETYEESLKEKDSIANQYMDHKGIDKKYYDTRILLKDFLDFAYNKADSLHSEISKDSFIFKTLVIIISLFYVVTFIFLGYKLYKVLQEKEEEILNKEFFIDQNVLTFKLDLDFNIIDSTNEACRFFNVSKEVILEKNFINFLSIKSSNTKFINKYHNER